jgi:RimJ/RimL family protein N-acetyltransferase
MKDGRSLLVRLAAPDDAEQVVRHVQAVGAETDNFSFGAGEFEGTADDLREDIQEALDKPNAVFLVALVDSELVGILSFSGGKRPRRKHLGDFSISVRQSHWGQGIGEALMRALIDWAYASDIIRKINLTVRADNKAAIALYEKVGFVMEGMKLRDAFINGQFVDSCCMGLEIDPPQVTAEGGVA